MPKINIRNLDSYSNEIHDFNKRFGYQMCVGCGRCDDACPQYISLSECIEKVADVVLVKEEAK